MKEKKKIDKKYIEQEALTGLSYGFQLVNEWKEKLKIGLIFKFILICLIIWLCFFKLQQYNLAKILGLVSIIYLVYTYFK
jgi:hypothetical protein